MPTFSNVDIHYYKKGSISFRAHENNFNILFAIYRIKIKVKIKADKYEFIRLFSRLLKNAH